MASLKPRPRKDRTRSTSDFARMRTTQRYRTTGSVAPGKMGGYRRRVLGPHAAFIVERIKQTPNLTPHRLKDKLAARGVRGSHNAVWQFLRREGLSFKKTLFALE